MAVQMLLRFAACEHREVIAAIKRVTAAAPPRPSVEYYMGMPSTQHAVRRCPGLASGNALNEMRQGRMLTLAALDGLRGCSDCTFFEGR